MPSKKPDEAVKKTKWARNVIITAVAFALFLSFLAVFSVKDARAPAPTGGLSDASGCEGLSTQHGCYSLERAESNQARIKGLSDRDSLAPQSGMLFVFDPPAEQCIWMKDMRFDLDIIWLDEAKKVIKLEQAVKPETYPASFCAANTKYVIEMNSGDAQALGLAAGQQLTL